MILDVVSIPALGFAILDTAARVPLALRLFMLDELEHAKAFCALIAPLHRAGDHSELIAALRAEWSDSGEKAERSRALARQLCVALDSLDPWSAERAREGARGVLAALRGGGQP